jgi:hypothetical protein
MGSWREALLEGVGRKERMVGVGGHNVLVTDLGERKHISNEYKEAPQYVQINVHTRGVQKEG